MNKADSGYVDEYNQLRAEIRMSEEHGSKSLQIVMALAAAAATFGSAHPDLLVISSLIVFYIWYDEIRHLQAIHRIASYLEVYVEPRISGLNWETTNRHHPFVKSLANRLIANAPFPTIAVSLALYGVSMKHWPLWIGILGVGILSGCLTISSYRTAKYGRDIERKGWQEIMAQHAPCDGSMPGNS